MKNKIKIVMLLLVFAIIGCSKDDNESTKSNEKAIISFTFDITNNKTLKENILGEIDEMEQIITATVSASTDITALLPTIQLPENMSISPNTPQDFTKPVIYTVTGEDGSTLQYTISFNITYTQKEVLVELYNANPDSTIDWNLDEDITTFRGVTLDENGIITGLLLSNKEINILPPSIGALTGLLNLTLYDNNMESVPVEIRELVNLERLLLYRNNIKSIPLEIGELTNLKSLNVIGNEGLKVLPAQVCALENTGTSITKNKETICEN